MRIVRCLAAGIAVAVTLLAQQPPETEELLGALARSAALFAQTAPALGARETLAQRARQGEMQVLKKGRNNELRQVSVTLPDTFESHQVISDFSMGSPGSGSGFHEIRRTLTFDGEPAMDKPPRHALTLGLDSEDDAEKKQLLENLEFERLQGSATDFGPLLLLFTATRQRDARFTFGGTRKLASGASAWILNYRQTGRAALTEFRNSRALRHIPEGQIWLREEDLLPVRITLNTAEILTPKYVLRNEAEVDYQPTRHGLAPASVTHHQYLNDELLVENRFTYSDYRGAEMAP